MKIFYLFLATILFGFLAKSQKIQYYRYDKVENEYTNKPNPSFYSFMVKRIYQTENQFTEFGLFTADTSNGLDFKKIRKTWYIYNGKGWVKFAPSKSKKIIIYRETGNHRIAWKKSKRRNTYYYEIIPEKGAFSHQASYLFDLSNGNFLLFGANGLYKRFDVNSE